MNLSAYMSSIRPFRWMSLYERIKKTGLSFEMIIVGPDNLGSPLPPEIKFFKSDVKPSQCFHFAGENCSGDIMLQLVDDLEYSEGSLEKMYEEVRSADNIMSTAHYFQDSLDMSLYQNISGYPNNPAFLPLLPVCGMFPRKSWLENKGLDVRFDGVMSELDFYMRLSINGYQTRFVDGVVLENTAYQQQCATERLCNRFWNKDRATFINLWSSNGVLYPIRNDIMRPYKNEDLLVTNQYYG